ncbi:boi-related E3 ubiquitin-protein ligase 1 [Phtheirospermum japonicum]|uniref:Boi-related E3 ubiquitin-protein ligase 1 n=1 Tax=Phtheirospermum japonicum TaxID=374723 RepID=A0A830D2F0_9LAMI|nr:boi-related E3 ubiquitin-protein ligase 1 [Phtheirospermum japonicum]
MAVEARHLNLFPGQLIQDRFMCREMLNPTNQLNPNIPAYNPPQMRFLSVPCAASLPENNQSFYQTVACETKTSVNTDSGLTYNYNISAPRKRARDHSTDHLYAVPNYPAPEKHSSVSQLPAFAGEDILPQLNQYQLEIDAIISQHTKKIRLELEERQKQQARMLAAALGGGVLKKLKEKDEQIQRMGKLNLALQERVKSIYVENQLWRDLAQSNEATANSLRSNLEQVLLHVGAGAGEERVSGAAAGGCAAEAAEDVESCCGSSDGADEKDDGASGSGCYRDRACRRCGERESCVLLLPCRHLCLCGVCGSGSQQVQACPVCNSSMNATLHVNMSS